METVKENTPEVKKKKIWPWVVVIALLLAGAGGAACWYFWPRPLLTAEMFVAADLETAPIYDAEGGAAGELVRGTTVTYVVEEEGEEEAYPGMTRLVMGGVDENGEVFEDGGVFAWIENAHLTDDPAKVVQTEKVYANMTMNLYDEVGYPAAALVEKGEELQVTGFEGLDENGVVQKYIVQVQRKDAVESGYITANYVCRTQEEASVIYNEKLSAIHAKRGDPYDGGDAKSLDYSYREKGNFPDNVMPKEVKALYLNNEFIPDVDTYLKIAKGCGINAFVIDIQDGGAVGYASPTMEKYSPSAYKAAWNGLEEYKNAVQKIKDAGYYVVGRITTFNDPYFAEDHPEYLIANPKGKPLKIGGMYWPSAYQRYVWQYKVDLALEAVELMGFNEIQFDYVRFPDGTWWFDDDEIDYRNTYGETKAQAIQRFLIYAADKLHAAGAYISADVFGETSNGYVCAYGQYWPAISNVVDAISAMPYPDHYGASGDWLPWEHPYDVLYSFGSSAAERQKETPCPAAVRTWIQAYSAIHEPYTYYGPNQIAAQIKALRDSGNTGGYMTWNAASSIQKYYDIQSALD